MSDPGRPTCERAQRIGMLRPGRRQGLGACVACPNPGSSPGLATGGRNSTSLTYDPLGRLLTKVTGTRASYTYTYNRAGNRLTEGSTMSGDPANGTATFAYDPLGRLVSYNLPGVRTISDTWHSVPNRDTLTVDGVPPTQGFDDANRPNTAGYAFDADGRMTARPGSSGYLEWDSLGRLVRVRASQGGADIAAYTYDALDRLLTRAIWGGTAPRRPCAALAIGAALVGGLVIPGGLYAACGPS